MRIEAGLAIVLFASTVTPFKLAHASGSATVQVQFVKATMQPGTIDPSVKPKFSPLRYTSASVIGTQQVAVGSGDTKVALPDGKQLTMVLAKSSKSTATVKLAVPGAIKSNTVELGSRDYMFGGKYLPYDGGDLFVILKLLKVQ